MGQKLTRGYYKIARVTEPDKIFIGEFIGSGSGICSWRDVRHDRNYPQYIDEIDVIVHEFIMKS